ncbi:MAG: SprT-like domain-containing protein [Actinomycetota bacterium]
MTPSVVLALLREEQARAISMVAGLKPCPLKVSRTTTELGSIIVDQSSGKVVEIRVSRHLADEAQVRETARHELAHQAAWHRYGDLGHGALWQTMAAYLGCSPVPCSDRALDPEVMRKRQRYAISCARCGWSTKRQRRSPLVARPWRFGCATCGGSLSVAVLALG